MSKQAKIQAALTVISFMFLAGLASSAPLFGTKSNEPTHSFVGTTPNATTAETLPATF